MFFNRKDDDEDETVRQTLERVMREKGLSQEPQVMHTEIGDFTYYDDKNTDNSRAYTLDSNTSFANQSGTNTASGTSSYTSPNTLNTTQSQTPTPWSNASTSQPVTPDNNGQQLRMPTGSQYQVTMPSYELQQKLQQPSTWDKVKTAAGNFADATQAATVGLATGASLGNFDEGIGALTAATTLNPNNYTMGRDATRQLQSDLQQRHPYIYGGAEFVGAMKTPMHLLKDTTFKNKTLNAATDTLNASAGYAENWKDFGVNLIANGIANGITLGTEKFPFGRAFNSEAGKKLVTNGRKFFKQGINSSADKAKNMFYKKDDEDDEEYYY